MAESNKRSIISNSNSSQRRVPTGNMSKILPETSSKKQNYEYGYKEIIKQVNSDTSKLK